MLYLKNKQPISSGQGEIKAFFKSLHQTLALLRNIRLYQIHLKIAYKYNPLMRKLLLWYLIEKEY